MSPTNPLYSFFSFLSFISFFLVKEKKNTERLQDQVTYENLEGFLNPDKQKVMKTTSDCYILQVIADKDDTVMSSQQHSPLP